MSRRTGAVLGILVMLLAACGCDPFNRGSQLTPSLPMVVGARITDGQLQLSTGTPCQGTSLVTLTFQPGYVRWALQSPTVQGVQIDRITLGGPPPPGLELAIPLPAGFDWRTSKDVQVSVSTFAGGGGSNFDPADIVDASAQHPPETFFFSGFGWLTPAEVAARDGKTLLTPCKPDPARSPKVPRAFGARVTDGRLQIWTGSPCLGTDRVILTFQPGQADLVLESDRSVGHEFERLDLGGPYPNFKVTQPLPNGFDWRTAQSLLLRVEAERTGFPSTTDLAEVLEGSTAHPDDTYFFQGVGWLSPADAAAKNTKDFLNTCTRERARK